MEQQLPSRIEPLLTPSERRVLFLYSKPENLGLRRHVRFSLQYAVGSGIFVYMCLSEGEPLWVLAVYAIFLIYLFVRILNASKIVGIMPSIIAKCEARIAELEGTNLLPSR